MCGSGPGPVSFRSGPKKQLNSFTEHRSNLLIPLMWWCRAYSTRRFPFWLHISGFDMPKEAKTSLFCYRNVSGRATPFIFHLCFSFRLTPVHQSPLEKWPKYRKFFKFFSPELSYSWSNLFTLLASPALIIVSLLTGTPCLRTMTASLIWLATRLSMLCKSYALKKYVASFAYQSVNLHLAALL